MTAELPLANVSVLVAEDSYFQADDIRRILEAAGAVVLGPCADAQDAIALLETQRPDCALLDLDLGSGPDFDPLRAALAKDVPVVVLTGYEPNMLPPDLSELPCLRKPADQRAIIAAVRAAHRRAERR